MMEAAAQPVLRRDEWNSLVASLPHSHVLQSWEWGEFKSLYGWEPRRLAWCDGEQPAIAAAQVLARSHRLPILGLNLKVLYCPKGPLLDWSDQELRRTVLSDLESLAAAPGVIQLKIEPDLPLGFGFPEDTDAEDHQPGLASSEDLSRQGWRASAEAIQFRNTMTLDLRPSEDDLLAAMKQKTRYNIRLASRKGVTVRQGSLEDLELLYRMYAETSVRDGFVIRHAAYYQHAWGLFIKAGLAQPLIAEVEGTPVAGLIAFRFAQTAWFLYGMSRNLHRQLMPNYLLQWEAIRWAKQQGCTTYDLWGAPDDPHPEQDLWGVYRFKRGLGGRLVRTLGPWDYTCRPGLYTLYAGILPKLLAILRLRARAEARSALD